MKDVDIREGYANIADAIRHCTDTHEPCEIWDSDEDMDDDPAPRCVMISKSWYEDLLKRAI